MLSKLFFKKISLACVTGFLFLFIACNSGEQAMNNASAGLKFESADTSLEWATWHVKFVPNTDLYARQILIGNLVEQLMDSVKAVEAMNHQTLPVTFSVTFNPFNDSLNCTIHLTHTHKPPTVYNNLSNKIAPPELKSLADSSRPKPVPSPKLLPSISCISPTSCQ